MRHESYFVLVKLQRIKVRGILVCARAAAADYSGARHFEVLKNVVFLLKKVFFMQLGYLRLFLCLVVLATSCPIGRAVCANSFFFPTS